MSDIQKNKSKSTLFIESKGEQLRAFGITPDDFRRELHFAGQIVSASKDLRQCEQGDLLNCVLSACSLGLSLNPVLKHAYIIARWNSSTRKKEPHVMPSYMGLEAKAMDTGKVAGFKTNLVYEDEEFTHEDGLQLNVVHKRKFGSNRKIVGVYCIVYFTNGMPPTCEPMDAEEVYKIRERSDSYLAHKAGKIRSCVWVSDEGEMFRKTVIRRTTKHLNLGESYQNIVSLDNEEYQATDNQLKYIERLIHSAEMDSERLVMLEDEAFNGNLSASRAGEIIATLKDNQKLTPEQALKRIT